MNTIYCEDCIHFVNLGKGRLERCKHPNALAGKVVMRVITPEDFAFCSIQRIHGCGLGAEWFEPRSVPQGTQLQQDNTIEDKPTTPWYKRLWDFIKSEIEDPYFLRATRKEEK